MNNTTQASEDQMYFILQDPQTAALVGMKNLKSILTFNPDEALVFSSGVDNPETKKGIHQASLKQNLEIVYLSAEEVEVSKC